MRRANLTGINPSSIVFAWFASFFLKLPILTFKNPSKASDTGGIEGECWKMTLGRVSRVWWLTLVPSMMFWKMQRRNLPKLTREEYMRKEKKKTLVRLEGHEPKMGKITFCNINQCFHSVGWINIDQVQQLWERLRKEV